MTPQVANTQEAAVQPRAEDGIPEAGTIRALTERLVVSPQLVRSRRLVRLLRHIVDATLAGQRRELSEMAIGLSVFDRDPSTYNPAEDPIVRVQVRRLRDKLAAYYAADGRVDAWHITVPCGGYTAVFRPATAPGARATGLVAQSDAAASNDAVGRDTAAAIARSGAQATAELIVAPLVSLNMEPRDRLFVDGLNEELIGALARATQASASTSSPVRISTRLGTGERRGSVARAHVLEGSIRRAGNRARASLRLSCAGDGRVVWAGQFDESVDDELAAQEALCAAVIRVIGTLGPLLA